MVECLFTGTLYDCKGIYGECLTCIIGDNTTGFQCGWCLTERTCSVMEECSSSMFTTSISNCPDPEIDSVEPKKGPLEGGTRIKITGTNLGAEFEDILSVVLLGNVTNEHVSCHPIRDGYNVGMQVVCETGKFSKSGKYMMVMSVKRGNETNLANGSYTVVQPTLSGVMPSFGPKSGGVPVTIRGSDLDIGNTEKTQVLLNGVDCMVHSDRYVAVMKAKIMDCGT